VEHPDSLFLTSLEDARKAAWPVENLTRMGPARASSFQHAPEQLHILSEGPIRLHELRHARDGMHDRGMVPIAETPPDFGE
jgi:hypothetical protein